jgi:hypothetical protein
MATNKPYGDNARKGAVKKRSQLKGKTMGQTAFTKRDKTSGEFMAQKKTTKFKGVRKEKKPRSRPAHSRSHLLPNSAWLPQRPSARDEGDLARGRRACPEKITCP